MVEYSISWENTNNNGDFKCPGCKALISPDDESSHRIVDVLGSCSQLEILIVQCAKCKAEIGISFVSSPGKSEVKC